ncbi:MAG TPA: hypothetical protein VF172_06375 [Nitrososphaera sp.]|jgi:hypothetical protein
MSVSKHHLHIGQDDHISEWIGKAMRAARNGTLKIDIANQPAAKIEIEEDGRINIDLLKPDVFKISEDETGIFDKLKTASEFGRKLSDNGVTLSFFRRGKEVLRLGKDAHPTFSKIITRSDSIQLTSVGGFAKLKGDLKTD